MAVSRGRYGFSGGTKASPAKRPLLLEIGSRVIFPGRKAADPVGSLGRSLPALNPIYL